MTPFSLKIVTPDGLIFDGQADKVVVRTTGGDICIQLQPDLESWINLVAGAQFYPAAKAEWMDVKQGVINVLQQALLGGDVETLLNDLQAQIAG